MKRLVVLILAMVIGSAAHAVPITSEADTALSGSTLIDFNSVAAGEYGSLSLAGVTIVGNGGTMTICTLCGGGGGAYGDDGQTLQNTSGSPRSFDLVFDSVVSAFGIQGGAFNNSWTYTAFDALDNIIEQVTFNTACCGPSYNGIAAAGIARVTLDGSGDWVVFDNLRFVGDNGNTVNVPEPGTIALLGLGLIGLGIARKRSS